MIGSLFGGVYAMVAYATIDPAWWMLYFSLSAALWFCAKPLCRIPLPLFPASCADKSPVSTTEEMPRPDQEHGLLLTITHSNEEIPRPDTTISPARPNVLDSENKMPQPPPFPSFSPQSEADFVSDEEKNTGHKGKDTMTKEETKTCPFCAETIRMEAKICRFCHINLVTGNAIAGSEQGNRKEIREVQARSGIVDGVKLGCGMFIVLPILIFCLSILFIIIVGLSCSAGSAIR